MRSIVGASVTAGAILEPVHACGADWPAAAAREELTIADFGVAGVRDQPEGPLLGFVVREELTTGLVREHLHGIDSTALLSDSAPLGQVLSALAASEFAFVVVGRGVEGIITRADLNKPPVRVYFFGLVSLLEMHLSYWIRLLYSPQEWETLLKEKRLAAARDVCEDRRRHRDEVELLECLQFCDKRDLLVAQSSLVGDLGFPKPNALRKLLQDAEVLRNDLAHSQLTLAQKKSWPDLVRLVEAIEALVHRSDGLIEARALPSPSALWRRIAE